MDSIVLNGIAVASVGIGSYFAGYDSMQTPNEVLTTSKVKTFPILASVTLVLVNLALESFGATAVNSFFKFYFILAGTNSIWFLLRAFFPKVKNSPVLFMYPKSHTIITDFILPANPEPFHLFDIPFYVFGIFVNIMYFKTYSPFLNNFVAASIATYAVLAIRIEKFTSAAPLLYALLLYDVFFVYETDMMTSVAMNLNGPLKLIHRKPSGTAVLGLGDVVIPGMFLSLCSRFDTFLNRILNRRGSRYWLLAMCGYVMALALTDYICYQTNSGQPALLYITPSVTIPIVLMTIIRKEYYAFLAFSA